MENREPMSNKIEDYLLGLLNPADRQSFESKLEQDESFATEVEQQKKLIHGVSLAARRELKADLKKIHQKVNKASPPLTTSKVFPLRRILSVAAALLALLAAVWWLWPVNTTPSQQLFAANYEAYPISIVFRNHVEDARWSDADKAYKNGQYEQALPILKSLLLENPQERQLQLGQAICLYETGQEQLAIQELQKIYDANDPFLKNQAAWYLGLFHLKNEQTDLAKSFLQPLANQTRADHHKEALVLLRDLE